MPKVKKGHEEVLLTWQHCRFGNVAKVVKVYGSWDDFAESVPLTFNGSTMFSETIALPTRKKYHYYFMVDNKRWTDAMKEVTTMESDEYNIFKLPMSDEKRETAKLLKQSATGDLTAKGQGVKSVDDLTAFNGVVEHLFQKWNAASGPLKEGIKDQIRQQLLNEVGGTPGLSLEESIVEFRRNIATLRIKLKENQIEYERELKEINDRNDKLQSQLDLNWKKKQENWRGMVKTLRESNIALQRGDMDCILKEEEPIKEFSDGKDLKDEKSVEFSQQQEIERLRFEILDLKKQLQEEEALRNVTPHSQQATRLSVSRKIKKVKNVKRNGDAGGLMMKKTIIELTKSLHDLRRKYNELQRMFKPKAILSTMKETEEQTLSLITKCRGDLDVMTMKYREMDTLRRRYFNEVQELKGNIRIFARSRPILPHDGKEATSIITFLGADTIDIADPSGKKESHRFAFDKVFAPNVNQEKVYKDVCPFVDSVMDGYHCCIFAYGQTGSGKTYTMQGTKENPGVNIRALQHLFFVSEQKKDAFNYKITFEMMEIYNEKIKDLLEEKDCKVRRGKDKRVYVENLSSHAVASAEDVTRLMDIGMKNRTFSATKSNEESSRSHMVLTISVTAKSATRTYSGKLNLVDLAGVSGSGMKEDQNINKSLSALGDVISALSQKSKHIPFRNSTLTQVLQSSLGVNSKLLMFVNFSPAQHNHGETLNALKFAKRAKMMELGSSKKAISYAPTDTPRKSVSAKRKTKKGK